MKKELVKIILGTAHRKREPGKQSPDGRLKECEYSRERVNGIKAKLEALGYTVLVDMEAMDLPTAMQCSSVSTERQRELDARVSYVNAACVKYGTENCLYVSIHVNGFGTHGKWEDKRGWSVYTSPGTTKADKLATCLWYAADNNIPKDNRTAMRMDMSDGDPDFEAKLYVLTKTKCAAVLTENLFQDNKEDVDFLLSEEGMHAIERLHVEGIVDFIENEL